MSSDNSKFIEANVIIFSLNHYLILNILLKIFCSFPFCHLKGVRNLHLGEYSVTYKSIHNSLFWSIYVIFLEFEILIDQLKIYGIKI